MLSVPEAIDHVGSLLEGGWPAIRDRNRRLALAGRAMLERLGLTAAGPEEMIGSMAALLLPGGGDPSTNPNQARLLSARLLDDHGVQAAVTWRHGSGDLMIRLSAHLHTGLDDMERLSAAVAALR
jgi:isopenicillin-N epimerase